MLLLKKWKEKKTELKTGRLSRSRPFTHKKCLSVTKRGTKKNTIFEMAAV